MKNSNEICKAENDIKQTDNILLQEISQLFFDKETYNFLKGKGINTYGQLVTHGIDDPLFKEKGSTVNVWNEYRCDSMRDVVNESLFELQLHLGMSDEEIKAFEMYPNSRMMKFFGRNDFKISDNISDSVAGKINTILNRNNIFSYWQLAQQTEYSLSLIKNMGSKNIGIISEMLKSCGLRLGMTLEELDELAQEEQNDRLNQIKSEMDVLEADIEKLDGEVNRLVPEQTKEMCDKDKYQEKFDELSDRLGKLEHTCAYSEGIIDEDVELSLEQLIGMKSLLEMRKSVIDLLEWIDSEISDSLFNTECETEVWETCASAVKEAHAKYKH